MLAGTAFRTAIHQQSRTMVILLSIPRQWALSDALRLDRMRHSPNESRLNEIYRLWKIEGWTHKAIGIRLGVSTSRARQLCVKAEKQFNAEPKA